MFTEARKHFPLFPLAFSPVGTFWNIANFTPFFFSRADQHVIKKGETKVVVIDAAEKVKRQ